MERNQELEYLKNLEPEKVLNALGIEAEYQQKGEYLLMHSPFREDKKPSFEAFYSDKGYWMYKDFGTGWKGSNIDLWMEVRHLSYVEAVRDMREAFLDNNTIEHGFKGMIQKERLAGKKSLNKEPKHKLLKVAFPEKSDWYIWSRGITKYPEWFKKVKYIYIPEGKIYYGVGVEDVNGVWHVRNKYGKINVITEPNQKPTYSFIKNGTNKLVIVEGLFDALSLNQMKHETDYDMVILNSTANTDRLMQSGILKDYKAIILALDNDKAGKEAEEKLLNPSLYRKDVEIKHLVYLEGCKDLNECLIRIRKGAKERVRACLVNSIQR